ncbi:MAG TPA: DUF4440 domain-containing protein [Gemmatimonadaceae bacterium]|nr:DUF4440 domain-containing protein [Gemmatimonadaceae bacterium]
MPVTRASVVSPPLAVVLTLLALAACVHAPSTTNTSLARKASVNASLDASRDGLLAADRAHAAASAVSLVNGFPAALADDAVLLYPNRPIVRGRAAAAALLASFPGAADRTMTWRPVVADVSADGTRGYTIGYGERGGAPVGSVEASHVKYLAFWKKGDDGDWRVAAWVLSGRAKPTGPDDDDRAPAGCPRPRSAFSPPPDAAAGPTTAAAARDAVLRADASFSALSARAGAGEAFATYVADDGASLSGEVELTCGREAVRRAFAPIPAGALVWEPRLADAAPSGDLGFTIGVATIRGEPTSHYSKYLTVWKKQPNGEWRFVADGGNPVPAP